MPPVAHAAKQEGVSIVDIRQYLGPTAISSAGGCAAETMKNSIQIGNCKECAFIGCHSMILTNHHVPPREKQPREIARCHSTLLDKRVVLAVERALQSTNYPSLRAVQVCEAGDTIVIRGKVPSYFILQMAQAVTMAIAFDRTLRNELQVDNSP